ncbi:hypothetical protein GGE07_001839 [Sinorhizobium terangae]|nr:hypothetical protein [Sinorhizobium terangae]MBB4185210.1 hypothetical protein [Sinorhizobium terangae]
MVGSVHDELYARGECAVAADHQAVADEIIVVEDALFFEVFRSLGVVVVAEIANMDERRTHDVLEEANARKFGDGKFLAGIRR